MYIFGLFRIILWRNSTRHLVNDRLQRMLKASKDLGDIKRKQYQRSMRHRADDSGTPRCLFFVIYSKNAPVPVHFIQAQVRYFNYFA